MCRFRHFYGAGDKSSLFGIKVELASTMTRIFIFLLSVIPMGSFGQKFTKCNYTYFKGGKVSTSQCFDTENRWGQARAFNKAGEIIYEKELRRIAGHSSVSFSFYENGGVKKAEWSSAPDAGIQWYHSSTSFSEDGNVTHEEHQNWDDNPGTTIRRSPQKQLELPSREVVAPKQEEVKCAEIWLSEYWVRNTAPYSILVTASRKGNNAETHTATLKPRQSLKLGEMPGAQMFEDPSRYFTFEACPLKNDAKRKLIVLPAPGEPDTLSRTLRRYQFEVRRIL